MLVTSMPRTFAGREGGNGSLDQPEAEKRDQPYTFHEMKRFLFSTSVNNTEFTSWTGGNDNVFHKYIFD